MSLKFKFACKCFENAIDWQRFIRVLFFESKPRFSYRTITVHCFGFFKQLINCLSTIICKLSETKFQSNAKKLVHFKQLWLRNLFWKSMSRMHMIDDEICYYCFLLLYRSKPQKYIKMIGLFVRNANEVPMMMIRRLTNVRFLSQTNRTLEKSSSASTPPPPPPPQTQPTESSSSTSSAQPWQKAASASHKLSNFDKRILVWSGKYKNVNEIPSNVAWV